jgi:response regulator receiver domain-containing protein
MAPVDGPSLLRWVRQHPDSPNPFMPFVMISGSCDQEKVQRARDLGVNDFLAKPFSVEAITAHLNQILRGDHIFVDNDDYFGPCRRKRTGSFSVERRGNDQSTTESTTRQLYYNPSVMPSKGFVKKKDFSEEYQKVDDLLIEKIKKELMNNDGAFIKEINKYIKQLEREYKSALNTPIAGRKAHSSRVHSIAHELRGLGGIFDYPLISIVAQSLFDLTEGINWSDRSFELINEHTNALKVISINKVHGMGGEVGQELIAILEKANIKFLTEIEEESNSSSPKNFYSSN